MVQVKKEELITAERFRLITSRLYNSLRSKKLAMSKSASSIKRAVRSRISSGLSPQPFAPQPKSILRPKSWTEEVEEAYRFQIAGYRDEIEYKAYKKVDAVDRWPDSGYVKKLQRKDGTFYYYNKSRECKDKDVHRMKIYAY